VGSARLFVITHPSVDRLHGARLCEGLRPLAADTILVPSGERQKCLRRAGALYGELLERGADRSSIIVAFGGGVIGDLAGFVAATYMRGIGVVQVPTTLLAQVDSAVGGKVAVNHPRAKNVIGCFHQPRAVLADCQTLTTLAPREYRAGLAEVVKHGVIADAALFAWMEQDWRAVVGREAKAVARMVVRSCEIKAAVVARDERESGLRAVLNFGHTVGHALESLTSYRTLRHGEGVAIGMVAASRLASRLGGCELSESQRIEGLLDRLGLPTRISDTPAEEIIAATRFDKKASAGRPRFILPRAIGHVEVTSEVPTTVLREVLVGMGAGT
jgi:3-dehydroquinate synthase